MEGPPNGPDTTALYRLVERANVACTSARVAYGATLWERVAAEARTLYGDGLDATFADLQRAAALSAQSCLDGVPRADFAALQAEAWRVFTEVAAAAQRHAHAVLCDGGGLFPLLQFI